MWQLFVTFIVASNLGPPFLRCANVVLTGYNWTRFSVVITHVFSADVFWPSHILFKYLENISVVDRTSCKDIINYIVFIFYLWRVIHQWNLVPFSRELFLIWSLFMQRLKYCVASFSLSEFVQFIYYIPCLRMFRY